MVEYSYDAWGNVLLISGMYCDTLGVDNPIRYRGYYYDFETDFYYLQSRYYDPAMGRFINADDTSMIAANGDFASYNLYAYCGNNPVARRDDGGEFWNFVIGGVVGGLIGGIVAGVTSYIQTGKVDWGSVAINAVVGAANGVIAATGLGSLAQAGLTAVTSGAGNFAEQCYTKGISNVNYGDVLGSAIIGGGSSLVGSFAGEKFAGNLQKTGREILDKGKDKLLTGMIRESMGQSHSALLRQGTKYASQGIKMINTYRGFSSSIGSFLGSAISGGYSALKYNVLGW